MQTLDEDSNGTVSRDEWHNYISSVYYKMRAEHVALHKIVTDGAHLFKPKAPTAMFGQRGVFSEA